MHQVNMTVERSYCEAAMPGHTSVRALVVMLVDASFGLSNHCDLVLARNCDTNLLNFAEFLDYEPLSTTRNN
jgi:hypothetical protein